jgi:hypothetical protein
MDWEEFKVWSGLADPSAAPRFLTENNLAE